MTPAPAPELCNRRHSLHRRLRPLVVLRLLVLSCACLKAGALQAGCGDYLFRNGQPVDSHHASVSSQRFSGLTDPAADRGPWQDATRRCHGPQCHGSPASDTSGSPLSTAFRRSTRTEGLLICRPDTSPVHADREIPQSERGCRYVPPPVFRPPWPRPA